SLRRYFHPPPDWTPVLQPLGLFLLSHGHALRRGGDIPPVFRSGCPQLALFDSDPVPGSRLYRVAVPGDGSHRFDEIALFKMLPLALFYLANNQLLHRFSVAIARWEQSGPLRRARNAHATHDKPSGSPPPSNRPSAKGRRRK